jgi:hypothetical protein
MNFNYSTDEDAAAALEREQQTPAAAGCTRLLEQDADPGMGTPLNVLPSTWTGQTSRQTAPDNADYHDTMPPADEASHYSHEISLFESGLVCR